MINNATLTGIADLIVGNTVSIPSYLALSSDSPTLGPADTTLTGEFGSRIALTKSRSGTVAQLSATRLAASSTSTAINAIGMFTASSSGNLWSEMLIPSLVQTTNFDVAFESWININGV